MIYSIFNAALKQSHLAGAASAQAHMRGLRSQLDTYLKQHSFAEVVLDFSGVEAITGSYARHTMGWLLLSGALSVGREGEETLADVGDGTQPMPLPLYPFATGLSTDVRDELQLALAKAVDLRLCFLEAVHIADGCVTEAYLIGDLDDSLQETLALVFAHGEASATELYEASLNQGRRGGITATGWNNRLADLHRLRVLRRHREGRHWRYAPVASRITVAAGAA